MVELLEMAVNAHGGLDVWRQLRTLSAHLRISGQLWEAKCQRERFDSIELFADLHRQRVVLRSERDDWCSEFTPTVITLSDFDGALIESCAFPRQAFLSSVQDKRWIDIQASYICSYAIWTFITLPFRYTDPAFSVEELPSWHEDGQIFRRLKVIFPDALQEHRREHVTYFEPQGTLWRHDCISNAGGIVPGAMYASQYETISGICMPLTRHLYHYNAAGNKEGDALVEVNLSQVNII